MMLLGCIADDFTGASDAASFIAKNGMNTILCNGIPSSDKLEQAAESADAVVIALKTRSIPKEDAVSSSLSALNWLKKHGAKYFYIKYCSTFDSTAEGNIGPVCDAAMTALDVPFTLLCPSLPINGRTVKNGVLYVNGVPLAQSHMKDHPLNPMKKSKLADLMRPQSRYPCRILSRQELMEQKHLIFSDKSRIYLVPDYENDDDACNIINRFSHCRLLTGGSGLLAAWAQRLKKQTNQPPTNIGEIRGLGIILAGSCSQATLRQIYAYQKAGGLSLKLDPQNIQNGKQTLEDIRDFMQKNKRDILLYSSESPAYLHSIRGEQLKVYADIIEKSLSKIAVIAQKDAYSCFIVAGGETSGAVAKALGYRAYHIGPSIAPGVPVMAPLEAPSIRIVLKSGNFGQDDFFSRALRIAKRGD